MIEAICDGCGRRIKLERYFAGFSIPSMWKVETQYSAITGETYYKIYCLKCWKNLLKKVKE